jgi:hypothetical protein
MPSQQVERRFLIQCNRLQPRSDVDLQQIQPLTCSLSVTSNAAGGSVTIALGCGTIGGPSWRYPAATTCGCSCCWGMGGAANDRDGSRRATESDFRASDVVVRVSLMCNNSFHLLKYTLSCSGSYSCRTYVSASNKFSKIFADTLCMIFHRSCQLGGSTIL